MKDAPTVQGVVALLIAPDGHVVCDATDFDRDGYGGVLIRDAQESRARRRLCDAAIKEFSAPAMARIITDYQMQVIVHEMCRQGGYRIHLIHIGHDVEPA